MEMTPERWREIERLVDRALRLPGAERARFLVADCSDDPAKLEQVLDLLLASSEAEAIATPVWSPAAAGEGAAEPPSQLARPVSPSLGDGERIIGSFRLLRTLGRGGMGTVYLAEQRAPVERQVAVKIAHRPLGSEGRLRLAAERQAMARLSHPNIAQVLEAGSTEDDHPYFAMELVDGPPITTYCDERRSGLEDRLRLFLAVCSGVQHAHQKGILHRDLKPNNLLIREIDSGAPVPKIIDFGIAKALDEPLIDHTLDTGERILGTPAYLSPESFSARGAAPHADTRGDVYSLGVLLLELLIGERPFAETPGETPLSQWRRKTEEDPLSPSRRWQTLDDGSRNTVAALRGTEPRAWGRRIRGDLDWIVLRAIARDPVDRYPGVSELAADVERHLADEPVLAGPPTASYQLRKLVRRHRGAVLSAAVLLLALAGGFVARSLEAARANRQAGEARAAREETEQVVDFLTGLFSAADPRQALGRELTVRELLQSGTDRLSAAELAATPRVRARLLHTTADVHSSLGESGAGLPLAEEALAIRRRELGAAHPDVTASLLLVARLESEIGNYERSEALLRQALAQVRASHGERSGKVAVVLKVLGAIHEETARYDEALAFYDRALSIAEEVDGPESIATADILNNQGVIHWRRGRYATAETAYRRALEVKEQLLDRHHPSLATTVNNLGDLLRDMERLEDSHVFYRRALEIRQKVLGSGHPHLGVTLNSMGNLQRRLGNLEAAEELLQRARTVWEEALGPEHDWVAYAYFNLGVVYFDQGRDREAEKMQRRALSIRRAALGESNPVIGQSLAMLGQVLRVQGRLEEAAQALDSAQEILAGPSGSQWFLARCLVEQGLLAVERERLETAEGFLARAHAMAEANDPPDSRLGYALYGLARLERARGRPREAEALVRRAVDYLAIDLAAGHRHLEEARELLAKDE